MWRQQSEPRATDAQRSELPLICLTTFAPAAVGAAAFALPLGGGAPIAAAVVLMVTAGMHDEIPVHDGDVLVDSRAATEQNLPQEGTFAEMRASLDLDRGKLLANLDSTINNSENENEKKNASAEKTRIMDTMEKELSVESMIKSKGLPESFVIMTDSSVTVTVDKQELDSNTVAKICDIVMRETGKTADKIVVQSKY